MKELYKNEEINDIDGVKIDFPDKWVHLRKSNTEPIIRVYSEAATPEAAEEIGQQIMKVIAEPIESKMPFIVVVWWRSSWEGLKKVPLLFHGKVGHSL